jgi:uncharacterized protein YoxC
MQITVNFGQLLLLITCVAVIIIFVYILQTLKNLENTVTNGARLFSRNEEQISQIITHIEQISANADEISQTLCGGRKDYRSAKPDLPQQQNLFDGWQDLQHAFSEVSASARKFRKTVKKLGS